MKGEIRQVARVFTALAANDKINIVVPYDEISVFEVQIHFNQDSWILVAGIESQNLLATTDYGVAPIYSQRVNFETRPGSGFFIDGKPDIKFYVDPSKKRTDNIVFALVEKVTPGPSLVNVIFSYIDQ